jgi:hypothetical protein
MSLSDEYRQLATLIDALESQGIAVREAAPVNGNGRDVASDRFAVQLKLELPESSSLDRLVVDDDSASDERERSTARGATASSEDAVDGQAGGSSGDTGTAADTNTSATEPSTDDAESTDTAGSDVDDAADDTVDHDPDADVDDEADDATDRDPDADGVVVCTHPGCDRTFESERGMKIHRTKGHSLSELIEPDAQGAVHQNPEALAEVYEKYDTFAEMTDALGVDVGAQAVRKQMIRHGIHEPEGPGPSTTPSIDVGDSDPADAVTNGAIDGAVERTNGTAERTNGTTEHLDETAERTNGTAERTNGTAEYPDETAERTNGSAERTNGTTGSQAVDADEASESPDASGADDTGDAADDDPEQVAERLPELDLPGGLTATELKSAVETANTLYDVQRQLDLDGETTRGLLVEYDLLELVSGRAASVRDREEMKSEIHERIRRTAT